MWSGVLAPPTPGPPPTLFVRDLSTCPDLVAALQADPTFALPPGCNPTAHNVYHTPLT